MGKLGNLFLYCGLSRESYSNVLPEVTEENRKNLLVFAWLGFVAFLFSAIMQMKAEQGLGSPIMLAIASVFGIMALLVMLLGKKLRYVGTIMSYIIILLLLAVGVYAGVKQPQERTTLLLVFFVLPSILFSLRILSVVLLLVVVEIIYYICIHLTQTGDVLTINTNNSVIFCGVGMVAAIYLLGMRYKKYEADYQNRFLIERDTLTSLYNRHSFENELDRIRKEKIPVAICSFDVNGLKKVNDALGHTAGDELLVASAGCISKVFRPLGKVFRIGGDEFAAILYRGYEDPDKLIEELRRESLNFHGKYISSVKISCGIAAIDRDMDFDSQLAENLKKADMLMYADKKRYYENSNEDRRKSR